MLRSVLSRCSLAAALILALGLAPVWAVPAAAQEAAPAPSPSAPAADGFQQDVAADLERTGEKLVSLAEAIPAEKYAWRPAEGVRSVSEVFVHAANANILLPVAIGAAPPEDIAIPESLEAAMPWVQEREANLTAKDEVLAALKESIGYAAGAVRSFESPTLEEEIQPLGFPASRRGYVLVLLTHLHEHLGQSIAYARSVGVTPPWSAAPEGSGEEDDSDAS